MDVDMDGKFHIHGKPANFFYVGMGETGAIFARKIFRQHPKKTARLT